MNPDSLTRSLTRFDSEIARVAAVMACLVGMERLITYRDLAEVTQQAWEIDNAESGIHMLLNAAILRVGQSLRTRVLVDDAMPRRDIRQRLKQTDRRRYQRVLETLLERSRRLATATSNITSRRDHETATLIYLLRLAAIEPRYRSEFESLGVKLLGTPRWAGSERTDHLILLRLLAQEAN
jgi:hypothetical protein